MQVGGTDGGSEVESHSEFKASLGDWHPVSTPDTPIPQMPPQNSKVPILLQAWSAECNTAFKLSFRVTSTEPFSVFLRPMLSVVLPLSPQHLPPLSSFLPPPRGQRNPQASSLHKIVSKAAGRLSGVLGRHVGSAGDEEDSVYTDFGGQFLNDRGGPQSPRSLATKVGSAPQQAPSQHQAGREAEEKPGPWHPGEFCLGS